MPHETIVDSKLSIHERKKYSHRIFNAFALEILGRYPILQFDAMEELLKFGKVIKVNSFLTYLNIENSKACKITRPVCTPVRILYA